MIWAEGRERTVGVGPLTAQAHQPNPPGPARRASTNSRSDTPKDRNLVERCVNKRKALRAVAGRYDKREYMLAGTIDVTWIRIWLRDPLT